MFWELCMPEFNSLLEYVFESVSAASPGWAGSAGRRPICEGVPPVRDPHTFPVCAESVCHRVTCLRVHLHLITNGCVCYLQPDVAGLFHWII